MKIKADNQLLTFLRILLIFTYTIFVGNLFTSDFDICAIMGVVTLVNALFIKLALKKTLLW